MKNCLLKAICVLFFCVAMTGYGQSLLDSAVKIHNELQAFKEADDLEGWIYHRIEYVDEKPVERINFLMQSQQRAWRSYQTYTERIAWFYMLATQGYYQLQSGNILSSIASYENALQFYESYPLPDADIIEYVLKPLGNNYTRLADYNTALFIHQKTLTAALKKGDRNTIASVYSNMAACTRWQGLYAAAEKFCLDGISYADKKKLLYGLLLSTYADILNVQERFDTAAVVVRQSLQQLQRYGNDMQALYWYTSALQIASRIAMNQLNFTAAAQHAQKALQLFDTHYPGLRQREKAKLFVSLGDIARVNGAPETALKNYQQALQLLLPAWKPASMNEIPPAASLYSENTFGDAIGGKAAVLEAMGKNEEAFDHYYACFAAQKKLRSAFYYTESKYKEAALNRSRSNAAMRIAYTQYKNTGQKKYLDQLLLVAEFSKAQVLADELNARKAPTTSQQLNDTLYKKMVKLQEAINYYQHELVEAKDKKAVNDLLQSAEYELGLLTKKLRNEPAQELLTSAKLQDMLRVIPPKVSVIQFFEGADSSYIIEADAGGTKSVRCIAAGRNVSRMVWQFINEWFTEGAAPMVNNPKKFYEVAHQTYKSVFGDFLWKTGQRYILMPDGIFSYLPFDALLTDGGYKNNYYEWPWFFKKAGFSQAWSLQTWYQQQQAKYQTGPFNGFFVSDTKQGSQTKLSVEQEYNSLKRIVSGEFFLNTSATWQHFNSAADSAGVLHIGSHAMMSSGDSMPFLQLYDKPFYLFDLRYKKFSPALVVLGACKTADGRLLAGEGINSLNRGFTSAGAGGVIAGLWNVNDETAIAFMEIFYRKLKSHDPAEALQQAKRQWLDEHRNNPALQLPYYWSGFIYSGHLQRVRLEQGGGGWKYYILPVLLMIVTAILFRFLQLRKSKKA